MKQFFFFLINIILFYSLKAQDISHLDKLQSLGSNINTDLIEGEPKISPDGKTLYFTRRNDPRNRGGKKDQGDIWFSVLQANGKWTEVKNLGKPVNTQFFNQVIAISPNSKIMLINGEYLPNKHSDIYITAKSYLGWTSPRIIPFKDLDFKNNDATYTATSDLKTLIISMKDYKNSYGKNDLYVSFLQADNTWSLPKNLGDSVNTEKDELYPTIAHDNKTLYFSSKGHGGYGDFDIFAVKRKDSTWLHWSKPINLGENINTIGYDADFTFDAENKNAYISSDVETAGDFDIYRLEMPKINKPTPVAFIYLHIRTKQEDSSAIFQIICKQISNNKIVAKEDSVKKSVKLILPTGKKYSIEVKSENFITERDTFNLEDSTKFVKIEKDNYLVPQLSPFFLKLQAEDTTDEEALFISQSEPIASLDSLVSNTNLKVESPHKIINIKILSTQGELTITLQNIFFGSSQSNLKENEKSVLRQLAKELQENKKVKVEIIGHTDNVGSVATNKQISLKRAKQVAVYLFSLGIPANRIQYKGMGETMPVAPNDTEEHRRFNRRVEIHLYK